MKKHLGNLGLLIAFLAILVAPLAGFKIVSYDQDSPQVLSETSIRKTKKEDKDEDKEHVFFHPSNIVKFFK